MLLSALVITFVFISYLYQFAIKFCFMSYVIMKEIPQNDKNEDNDDDETNNSNKYRTVEMLYYFCAETYLKLQTMHILSQAIPVCGILLFLFFIMMVQTHIHAMALTRVVFGEPVDEVVDEMDLEDLETEEERQRFNPFDYDFGNLRDDWLDPDEQTSYSSSEGDDETDDDSETDDDLNDDEEGVQWMFNDEVALNGSLLSVLLLVSMVGLTIQSKYGLNAKFHNNKTNTSVILDF